MTTVAKHGIYFGYARVHFPEGKAPEQDMKVWPMVMSMGWNPYYKNVKFTAVNPIPKVKCNAHEITGGAYHAQVRGGFLWG